MRFRLILAVGLAAAVGWARRGGVRHVVVEGDSMTPALRAGDRVLLVRLPGRPRRGHIALAPDPRAPARVLLKRVHSVTPDGVDLRGDDPDRSTDSRQFGRVPTVQVRAYLPLRYATAQKGSDRSATFER